MIGAETRIEGPGAGRGWGRTVSPRSRAACIIPAISGEPFDFITWFDYAPEHERDFYALLAELRASEEWAYVEGEIDIRLVQGG